MKSSLSNVKSFLALSIFVFVNFIFSIKYLSRVTDYYLMISIAISCFYLIVWKHHPLLEKYSPRLILINKILFGGFVVFAYIIFKIIPVETLNVDRWSVITSFWQSYFNGDYVYFAKSHMGNAPGPMPFYFILALPFYAIEELGFLSLFGGLFFFVFLRYQKINLTRQTMALVLVCTSIFYLWEIVSRSNIFFNAVLILILINFILPYPPQNLKSKILMSLAIGLSLSTRIVFFIPIIVAFVFLWKTKKISTTSLFLIAGISLAFFCLTFIPFVYGHFQEFLIMNPFIIQAGALMPFKYTVIFVILAFIAGLVCKGKGDVHFYAGLVLFLCTATYFAYHILRVGLHETFINSVGDVSYFIMCTPFILYYIIINNESKQNDD